MKIGKIIFPTFLTISIFSFWAAFALLVVNKLFHNDLPGYTIGEICVWEYIALVVAGGIAYLMIKNWGNIQTQPISGKKQLVLHKNYGIYFSLYFGIAVMLAIWQFWLFSRGF